MLFFYDTETTGVSGKPYLVQLAGVLTDLGGKVRGSCNLTVKPDGYEIPQEAASIHGINTELALNTGISLKAVMSIFDEFLNIVKNSKGKVITHNKNYDLKVAEHCYERMGWNAQTAFRGVETYCTMEGMKNFCKLPMTARQESCGMKGYKSPKLSEAYKFAFGQELTEAHNALFDVKACMELYFWIVKQSPIQDPSLKDLGSVYSQRIGDGQPEQPGPVVGPTLEAPAYENQNSS